MGHVPLGDALSLVTLYVSAGSPKAEAAAVRWLARLALERPRTTIAEVQLATATLAMLAEQPKHSMRTEGASGREPGLTRLGQRPGTTLEVARR